MQAGEWWQSVDHDEPCRVVDTDTLWGQSTCLVWLPRRGIAVRVLQKRLTPLIDYGSSSTATQHGGQETTLFSIITNLLHFGAVVVGLDYGHAGLSTLDEIAGGTPYGATTIAGVDGSRLPSANELQGARYQGRKIAETANKLHG